MSAISASCCLVPHAAVAFRGKLLLDGGLTDPMPEASQQRLPTVTVSVLAGDGVDVAPSEACGRRGWEEYEQSASAHEGQGKRNRVAEWRRQHPFLRYDVSWSNGRALFDASVMPTGRAQWRFEQGQLDGLRFLRAIGHDPPPPLSKD